MDTTTSTRFAPYTDAEVAPALHALFTDERLLAHLRHHFPAPLVAHWLAVFPAIDSVFEFQKQMIYPMLKHIEQHCITTLTHSGLNRLAPQQRYLFISNHRDIVLDSAFMNMLLFEQGIPTSQIAIGDNLMQHPIAASLFHLNKSFVVRRTGNPRELYASAIQLSRYVHETITTGKDSVWIAQREGRAKDGNDRTQVSLLKMLLLAAQDTVPHLQQLRIVPLAISYELDPCDDLKTAEYLKKQTDPTFKKSFQTDVEHMLLGIMGRKGRVHFHFGTPLHDELAPLQSLANDKDRLAALAAIIDREVHRHFKLHPINYVAADLLAGQSAFAEYYTAEAATAITADFERKLATLPAAQREVARQYLLGMYATPVHNALAAS